MDETLLLLDDAVICLDDEVSSYFGYYFWGYLIMSVTSHIVDEQGVVEIGVSGRFDFSLQKDFRAAYRDCPADLDYRVDLSRVDYLDSAALGMLLLLRQHAGDTKSRVTLCAPNATVDKILRVANFDRIFDID